MNIRLPFLLILLLLNHWLYSQSLTFQKTYQLTSDHGNSVDITQDGGYIIASGGQGAGLTKTDSTGAIAWSYYYDTGGSTNFQVHQTFDKGYILTNFNNFNMIKVDSMGTFEWSNNYGPGQHDWGYAVIQTRDSGFAGIGVTRSFSTGGTADVDVYLVKTNSQGALEWSASYGSYIYEGGLEFEQTYDGGFIIGAQLQDSVTSYYLIIKTDSIGNLQWSKKYFGNFFWRLFTDIKQTFDGGYLIMGHVETPWFPFTAGTYLTKIDGSGNLLWAKFYEVNYHTDQAYSLEQTADSGFVIAGGAEGINYFYSVGTLLKINSTGDPLWIKAYGNPYFHDVRFNDVKQTTDKGFILVGTKNINHTFNGIYLVKTDSLGESPCNQRPSIVSMFNETDTVLNYPLIAASHSYIYPLSGITGNGCIETPLCNSMGVNESEVKKNNIKVFPNPASSTLKFISHNKEKISITDLSGKVLIEKDHSFDPGEADEINISTLKPGIYFIKAGSVVGKFVKE